MTRKYTHEAMEDMMLAHFFEEAMARKFFNGLPRGSVQSTKGRGRR